MSSLGQDQGPGSGQVRVTPHNSKAIASKQESKQARTRKAFSRSHALEGLVYLSIKVFLNSREFVTQGNNAK